METKQELKTEIKNLKNKILVLKESLFIRNEEKKIYKQFYLDNRDMKVNFKIDSLETADIQYLLDCM